MYPWQCGQLPRAAWRAGKASLLPQPQWDAGPAAPKPGLGVCVVSASFGSYQRHLAVLALAIALTMLHAALSPALCPSIISLLLSWCWLLCAILPLSRLPPARGGSTHPYFPPTLPAYTHSSCFPSRSAHLQELSISLCSTQTLQKIYLAR